VLSRPYAAQVPGANKSAAAYLIRPCGRIAALELDYTIPTTLSVKGIVLESNTFPWTVGHNVEQVIAAYTSSPELMHIYVHDIEGILRPNAFVKGGDKTIGGGFFADNFLLYEDATLDSLTHASVKNWGRFQGNARDNGIIMDGRVISGFGLTMIPTSTDDPKTITWQDVTNFTGSELRPTSTGFRIGNKTALFELRDTTNNKQVTFDVSGHSNANVTIVIPDAAGTMALAGAGANLTINVRKADDSGSCTISTNAYGAITGTTCP
jgi:hypothetical protein